MQDSKAEAIEKTADSDSTENEAAEKTVSEEKTVITTAVSYTHLYPV